MIRTRDLSIRYPGGPELAFADVDLVQGRTLLLRGNSGAGKSTWLALVAGLLTPASGEVIVAGQRLGDLSGAARDRWRGRTLGFLPQKLHLSDALTVEGNLALAFYAAGLPADRGAMARTLDALGIGQLAHRRPGQLSGGQAQRVALARSLLLQPRLILADEPTASLDDDAAAAAVALLEEGAHSCGASLVIATHDVRVQEALPAALLYQIGLQPAPAADSLL